MVKSLKELFGNMSLMKKLTLAYSLTIMIPTVIIGFYTYSGFQNSMKEEIRNRLQKNVYQMTENITSRIDKVKSVSNILANDTRIKYFMYLSRKLDEKDEALYHDYVESADPLLTDAMYFHSFDLFKISIYINSMEKPDIGERRDIVFSDARLQGFDWYSNLKQGAEQYLWLPAHVSGLYSPFSGGGNTMVFTLAQKIFNSNNEYLGVSVLDIRRDDVLSSIINFNREVKEDIAYVIDKEGNIVLSPYNLDKSKESEICKQFVKNNSGFFYIDKDFYAFERVEELGISVICKANMQKFIDESKNTVRNIILVLLSGLVILIGLTYLLIRTIFKRLKDIVSIMNSVAKGKFDIRIPAEQKDEVGQLAEDFNILIEKINNLIKSLLEKEIAQRDAQLLALQYQINPHFIYNMIDTFRMRMVLLEDHETANALTDFVKMLRYNISNQSKFSTIKDEIDILWKYINLQKFKYKDRINLSVHLLEEMNWVKIIKFILQPVVENSIKHGLMHRNQILNIRVEVTRDKDIVRIVIMDDGVGIEPEKLDKINYALKFSQNADETNTEGSGIGLFNINRRLKLFYGDEYHVGIDSRYGEYTKIEIAIPCES